MVRREGECVMTCVDFPGILANLPRDVAAKRRMHYDLGSQDHI
jgi:hypothetical protein